MPFLVKKGCQPCFDVLTQVKLFDLAAISQILDKPPPW
jgi:hypothetical protein